MKYVNYNFIKHLFLIILFKIIINHCSFVPKPNFRYYKQLYFPLIFFLFVFFISHKSATLFLAFQIFLSIAISKATYTNKSHLMSRHSPLVLHDRSLNCVHGHFINLIDLQYQDRLSPREIVLKFRLRVARWPVKISSQKYVQ